MAIAEGARAPDFKLQSTEGPISLRDLRGSKVVLYFYPKDDTPGCTREACDFRDNLKRLEGHGAVVLGISKDSLDAHGRFQSKYGLPFNLASDPDNATARAYGAFGEKMLYGRRSEGTIRSTFLIDEQGVVQRAWSPVKVDGHVDAVLAALEGKTDAPATRKPVGKKPAAKKAPAKKPVAKKAAARKPAPKKKSTARR